jgi:hypothetical protein
VKRNWRTRTGVLLAVASAGLGLAAGAFPAAASAALGQPQSEQYYGNGDLFTTCPGDPLAGMPGDPGVTVQQNVGGGCFAVDSGAATFNTSIADDHSSTVGGLISFQDASGNSVGGVIGFCSSDSNVAIPSGAATIFVAPAGPLSYQLASIPAPCSSTQPATTGTITLTDFAPVTTTTA